MSMLLFNILFLIFLIDTFQNNYINNFSLKEESQKEKLLLEEFEPINYNNLENNFNQKNLFFAENKDKYKELNELSDSSRKNRDIISNLSFAEIPENLISRYEDKYQKERKFKIIRSIEKRQNMNNNNHHHYKNNHNYNNHNDNNYYKNLDDDEDEEYFSDKHNFYGNKNLLNFDYHY